MLSDAVVSVVNTVEIRKKPPFICIPELNL